MMWLFFAVIVVAGFALLKVRRRRKVATERQQLLRFESGLRPRAAARLAYALAASSARLGIALVKARPAR